MEEKIHKKGEISTQTYNKNSRFTFIWSGKMIKGIKNEGKKLSGEEWKCADDYKNVTKVFEESRRWHWIKLII